MPAFTPEEIQALETSGNETLAAVAKKLKSETFIPKDRFDEINKRAKDTQDALDKIKADNEAAEARRLAEQGEYKTIAEKEKAERERIQNELNDEKKYADQFRALRAAKIEKLKKDLGDDFLPEYESFSLESLEKIASKRTAPGATVTTPPGGVRTSATLEEQLAKAIKDGRPNAEIVMLRRKIYESQSQK